MHSPDGPISQRHVSPLLATAIFAVPPIFVWVLLRRGYAPSTRRAGFLFAGVNLAWGMIYLALGG